MAKKKKGRPTEYDPKYISEVDKYLADCQDETRGKDKIKVKIPTIEGFALRLNVSKKSLYNWSEQHEDFLHSLDKINEVQKERLIANGLSGDYNSTIAKLVLSANHGMREKTDNKVELDLPQNLIDLFKHVSQPGHKNTQGEDKE